MSVVRPKSTKASNSSNNGIFKTVRITTSQFMQLESLYLPQCECFKVFWNVLSRSLYIHDCAVSIDHRPTEQIEGGPKAIVAIPQLKMAHPAMHAVPTPLGFGSVLFGSRRFTCHPNLFRLASESSSSSISLYYMLVQDGQLDHPCALSSAQCKQ